MTQEDINLINQLTAESKQCWENVSAIEDKIANLMLDVVKEKYIGKCLSDGENYLYIESIDYVYFSIDSSPEDIEGNRYMIVNGKQIIFDESGETYIGHYSFSELSNEYISILPDGSINGNLSNFELVDISWDTMVEKYKSSCSANDKSMTSRCKVLFFNENNKICCGRVVSCDKETGLYKIEINKNPNDIIYKKGSELIKV